MEQSTQAPLEGKPEELAVKASGANLPCLSFYSSAKLIIPETKIVVKVAYAKI